MRGLDIILGTGNLTLKNFVILTNGRSGSNFLVDTINQHPQLFNYGELLGHWSKKRKVKQLLRIKTEEAYVEYFLQSKIFFYFSTFFYLLKDHKTFKFKKYKDIHQVGFKDFGINFERYGLKDWLVDNHQINVIHLYRANHLDRYLSLIAMKETGLVSAKTHSNSYRVKVDCKKIVNTLQRYEEEMQFQFSIASHLSEDRLISISYEQLFTQHNTSAILHEMFIFLGVDPINIEDRHVKILSSNIQFKVINFEELCETLKGTKFEHFLSM
jgi:LPS sulfotransferase NodH